MDVQTWAHELILHLKSHIDGERDVVRTYGVLAEGTENDAVRYLINLILDDQVRHHRQFTEMINWLLAETETATEDRTFQPRVPSSGDGIDDELLEQTRKLLELERHDLRELRNLRKAVDDIADTDWWTVLIDSMESDTRKHLRILEYIESLAG